MRTKSGNGKRKYEDDEMSERRVTRSFNSGKKSVHSSASTDEIDNNKPTTQRRIGLDGVSLICVFSFYTHKNTHDDLKSISRILCVACVCVSS